MLRPNLPAIDDKEGVTVLEGLPIVVDAHVHIFPNTKWNTKWGHILISDYSFYIVLFQDVILIAQMV